MKRKYETNRKRNYDSKRRCGQKTGEQNQNEQEIVRFERALNVEQQNMDKNVRKIGEEIERRVENVKSVVGRDIQYLQETVENNKHEIEHKVIENK